MKTWVRFTKLLMVVLCLLITSCSIFHPASLGSFTAEKNNKETLILTEKGPVSIKLSDIPHDIKKYAFDFEVDVEKLHKLKAPITNITFANLEWHLDITPWDHEGRPLAIGPRQVLNNPSQYARHYARIIGSDISFPLDISYNNGRWVIIDGLHRLTKIFMAGAQKNDLVAVRVHSHKDLISCMDLELTPPEIVDKYFQNVHNNP